MPEAAIIAITIIMLAVIIGMTINGIVGKVMEGKRLRHAPAPALDAQELRTVAERQAAIEDRLRVLERIATDRGNLLADEIEALRRETPAIGAREAEVAAR